MHSRVIVFYNFDYELYELRQLFSSQTPLRSETSSSVSTVDAYGAEGNGRKSVSSTIFRHSASPVLGVTEKANSRSNSLAPFSMSPVVAEWNGHKHEVIPTSESWVYLVQYVAGAEGWNCTTTDTVVFYSLTYSYKIWEQAYGRIDRINTPYSILNYYVLRSNSWIDSAIFKSLSEKRNFNERDFGKSWRSATDK